MKKPWYRELRIETLTLNATVMVLWLVLVIGLPVAAVGSAPGGPKILNGVGIDQNLGEKLPLDAIFRDESGRDVRLGAYFGRRPV